MILEYDPNRPDDLGNDLALIVDNYWSDYDDYWEISTKPSQSAFSEEERATHRSLEQLAAAIKDILHTLTPTGSAVQLLKEALGEDDVEKALAPNVISYVFRVIHASPLVRDRIVIALHHDAIHKLLPTAEKRVPDLVALISSRGISERAAAYLDRATRLHLWGFDAECVIMCRSVLESALQSALSDLFEPDAPCPPLDALIKFAGESNRLSGYQLATNKRRWKAKRNSPLYSADRLRFAGNRLIHDLPVFDSDHPEDIKDSLTALRELAKVLQHLFRPQGINQSES